MCESHTDAQHHSDNRASLVKLDPLIPPRAQDINTDIPEHPPTPPFFVLMITFNLLVCAVCVNAAIGCPESQKTRGLLSRKYVGEVVEIGVRSNIRTPHRRGRR